MKESKNLMNEAIKDNINTISFIEIKEYKGSDNILYNIKIFQGEKSILIQIRKLNDFSEIIYEGKYTLEELYNINYFLRRYSSIKEIFKELFKEVKNREITVFSDEKKINLEFKFEILGKMQTLKFDIKDYKLDNNKIILKLCNRIIEIEKFNIELKNRFEEQNRINKELNKRIEEKKEINKNKNKIDGKLKEYTNEYNEFIKNKNKWVKNIIIIILMLTYFFYNNIKFKSIIEKINNIDNSNSIENINNIENIKFKSITEKIENIEDIKLKTFKEKINIIENTQTFLHLRLIPIIYKSLINEGIKKYFNMNIKTVELLYQASKDGFEVEKFHKNCDNKKNTIILIITDNNKIFGGFTELEWDDYSELKEGNKGFIFSISNNKLYYNKSKYKIECREYLGPTISGGFGIDGTHGYDFTYYESEFNISKDEDILSGKLDFNIKDYAVYQINFE